MNKNKKILFLAAALVTVLILISAVNATNTTDKSIDNTISEKTSTQTSNIIKEKTTTKTEKTIKENKTINKKTEEKAIKNDPVTIDGITYTKVYENEIITGEEPLICEENTYINNCTINFIIPEEYKEELYLVYAAEVSINNTKIYNGKALNVALLHINNSFLDNTFYNSGTCYIDDNTKFGSNFVFSNKFEDNDEGTLITTNPWFEEDHTNENSTTFNGNYTFENINITTQRLNYGNLTLINSNISELITNNGNISFINCSFSNNNMILGSLSSIDYAFLLDNKGTARLENCIVENNTFNTTETRYNLNRLHGAILNNGNMTVVNTVARNNSLGYVKYEEGTYAGTAIGRGAVLSNFGNLTVDDSTFKYNYAGESGAAIFNVADLSVDNSIFENNLVTLRGGAISTIINQNGVDNIVKNILINNSQFKNNIVNLTLWENPACGGAIYLEQSNSNIKNCTFDNNIADTNVEGIMGVGVEAASIVFEGVNNNLVNPSIIIDNCTFINHESRVISNGKWVRGVNGILNNCIFENNNGGIIDKGNLNITNNIFKNTSNTEYLIYDYIQSYGQQKTISNNQFINNSLTADTIYNYTSDVYDPNEATIDRIIENNIYINTTISDSVELVVPSKIYTGEPVTVTGTYAINNPENYDPDILDQTDFNVYINSEFYQTVDTLEFTVTPTAGNMIITVQPTISQTRKSTSIRPTTLTNIIITPENYSEYIYEGALIGVSKDSKIIFQGMFQDKGNIAIDTPDIILDGTDAQFTNTVFKLESTGITIQNMDINNSQTDYPIINTADNNIITQNTISLTNTNGKTAAIYNKASNTEITYNTLYVDGPAIDIDHNDGYGIANTQAILLIGGDKNKVEYNTVKVTTTGTSTQFGTTEAITNHKEATNTIISNNNITLTGNAKFKYGINSLNNIENITITNNNIQVSGERYTDGIQIGTGANNILIKDNTIKCVCQNTTPVDEEAITYGITTVTVGGIISNNITIQDNNIDLTGTANYGIELYTTNNTLVENNTINVNGPQSMGIGLAHSPNSTIIGNDIKTSGDSTIPLGTITEEIQPANVGIQLQQDSNNILIEDNTIQTYDKAGQDNCINVETSNVTIRNNNLTSSTKTGTATVDPQLDTVLDNNNAIEQESSTTTEDEIVLGESTTLTASFYDDEYVPISEGKAIFRINGKTLRDDQGNVIYADVINGRAELPDVNITSEWTKEGTTIQAVYCGNENVAPIMAEESVISVTQPEATIELEAPEQATAGQTITLKASVTDGEKAVNSGRVAFKLNGKTLKDEYGKALYANVENGVATVTYTIPEKTKAKTYTLTAVFTDTLYDRQEAETELKIAKA